MQHVLWEETLPGGATWSHVLKRGTALRLTDLEGSGNAGAVFLNVENPVERYNMPDTLKAQHIARLTKGNVLYSDMGRVLCSITDDTLGWHDPLGGAGDAAKVERDYGTASYQTMRNAWHRNAKDGFLIELEKYGLGLRDLPANVNFFSKVSVDEDGKLRFWSGHSCAGDSVTLRAEMNVLAIVNTCQHPMDPNRQYAPKPVGLTIERVPAPSPQDPCRVSCPENQRGFVLTERYFV